MLFLIIKGRPVAVSSNKGKAVETRVPDRPILGKMLLLAKVRLNLSQAAGFKPQFTFSKDPGFYGLTSEVTSKVTIGQVTPMATTSLYEL